MFECCELCVVDGNVDALASFKCFHGLSLLFFCCLTSSVCIVYDLLFSGALLTFAPLHSSSRDMSQIPNQDQPEITYHDAIKSSNHDECDDSIMQKQSHFDNCNDDNDDDDEKKVTAEIIVKKSRKAIVSERMSVSQRVLNPQTGECVLQRDIPNKIIVARGL